MYQAPSARPGFAPGRPRGLPRPFWVLWSGTLINRLGTMVEPFLGLYLVGVRGLSVVAAGAVLAVYGVGSMISQLLGGFLADTLGRRATFTMGMLANGAAAIALGYVTAIAAVITTTFAFGVTIDLYRPASQAMVADLIPSAERTRAYGLMFWAANLGFSIAMVFGGTLAQAGYRWLFWADALSCTVFALLVWRAVPETRVGPAEHGTQARAFREVLRDRVMIGFTLAMLGHAAVYQQAFTTLPLAMRADGLPPRAYGLAMAFNGITIVLVQPLISRWLGRHDHSLVIVVGNVLIGAGFTVTSLASSALTYMGAVFVWTLGEIAVAAVGGAIVAGLATAHLRGRYLGLFGAAWSTGALLAPLGGTPLLDLGAPTLWLTCGAVAAVVSLSQLALTPAIRCRTRPESPGFSPTQRPPFHPADPSIGSEALTR